MIDRVQRAFLAAMCAAAALSAPSRASAIEWAVTGAMSQGRDSHVALRLTDGRVLIASMSSAEAYDVGTGVWSSVSDPPQSISGQVGVVLDSGAALFVGGKEMLAVPEPRADAQLYDPATNTWSVLASMAVARSGPLVVKLANGHVVVAGGNVGDHIFDVTGAVESFDPSSQTWSALEDLTYARFGGGLVQFKDGRLFLFGGKGRKAMNPNDAQVPLASTEILAKEGDPWAPGVPLPAPRFLPDVELLLDGRVMAAGGAGTDLQQLATVVLYDTTKNQWADTGGLTDSRSGSASALLRGGCVMISGGANGQVLSSVELYDPSTGIWTPGPDMPGPRQYHSSVVLESGDVIVVGGEDAGHQPTSATWLLERTADAAACAGNCECRSGACIGGTCCSSTKAQGDSCSNACECVSGNCVDGVCCNELCDGACQACASAATGKLDGVCAAAMAGTDPRDDCGKQPVATCGRTGTCDGKGACAIFVNGTTCSEPTCSGHELLTSGCQEGQCTTLSADCSPFACSDDPLGCLTSCKNIDDCSKGFVCTSQHECIPTPQNQPPDEFGGCCGVAGHGANEPWRWALLPITAVVAFARRRRRGIKLA